MSTNRIVNIKDQENSAAANIPGNFVNKENTKVNPPKISKIQRIPLGGKNQNSNQFSLNRSQSSLGQKVNVPLAKDTFRPPSLVKSNSSLGFIPPFLNHHITVQRDVPTIQKQTPKQVEQPKPEQVKQLVPEQTSSKRLLPLKNDLPTKRIKLEVTDSLVKPQPLEHKPLNTTLQETFSSKTGKLHASNIIQDDINKNNVDPIKKQPQRKLHVNILENEVEITPSIRETNPQYPIEPLNESDLQFFSTPNNSKSEFNKNENILNAGIPDISLEMSFDTENTNEHDGTIVDDAVNFEDSELGLSITDLHTLLD